MINWPLWCAPPSLRCHWRRSKLESLERALVPPHPSHPSHLPSLDVALSLRANDTSVPAAPTSPTNRSGRWIQAEGCPSICAPLCSRSFCSGTVGRRWLRTRTTSRTNRVVRWSGGCPRRAQVSVTLRMDGCSRWKCWGIDRLDWLHTFPHQE